MQAMMERLELIRDNCRVYGNNIRGMLGSTRLKDDPRHGCLWMIHNRATLALEVLDYFLKMWSSDAFLNRFGEDALAGERAERCIEVTKSFFISTMSAIEYSSKQAVGLYPGSGLWKRLEELRGRNRYIFLKGIVQESESIGLLDEREAEEYVNLILLRNIVTHNNSISDTDADLKVSGTVFTLRTGEMVRGDIGSFVMMSERAVERYYGWICRLHSDARRVMTSSSEDR